MDQGGFLLQFPVWLVSAGGFRDVLKIKGKNDGFAAVVFTDNDLAREAIPDPNESECFLIGIPNSLTFLGLLHVLEDAGMDYVAIDPTKRKAHLRSIRDLQKEFASGIK